MSLEALAEDLIARAEGRARFLVAIAGAPASGKSTLAEDLLAALERLAPGQAALMPMDGYHFDDAVLDELGYRARPSARAIRSAASASRLTPPSPPAAAPSPRS